MIVTLQSAATTTATGTGVGMATNNRISESLRTFQSTGTTSAGSGAATVLIEVSNDNVVWLTLGTITLTLGTSATSDGFASNAPWGNVRARVSSISGTNASVTTTMGLISK
jgi:hypothetical protein